MHYYYRLTLFHFLLKLRCEKLYKFRLFLTHILSINFTIVIMSFVTEKERNNFPTIALFKKEKIFLFIFTSVEQRKSQKLKRVTTCKAFNVRNNKTKGKKITFHKWHTQIFLYDFLLFFPHRHIHNIPKQIYKRSICFMRKYVTFYIDNMIFMNKWHCFNSFKKYFIFLRTVCAGFPF